MRASSTGEVGIKRSETRRIRVLEIVGNAIVGGVESMVYDLIRSLSPDEFEVTCVCPYESPFTAKLRGLGCKVYITAIRDDPPWNSVELVAAVIEQQSIDVVHAHLLNAHTLAAISGQLTGTPVVATIHSMALGTQEISVARLAGSHLITVCQQAFAQALAAGVAGDNISIIPNGIDVGRFHPDRSATVFRGVLKIPPSGPLIGFVGRLSPEKGADKFVLAADRICQERSDVHCVLVGEGPESEMLQGMIRRLEFGDRIHLAGKWTNTEEVYPAFDILLQTSRSEAMPLAIIEAMACGIPVIALAVGGVAEIIEAGTTGIHISPVEWPGVASPYPGDWPGIARAALDLLAKPERRKQMGSAGRQRVIELFNLTQNIPQVTGLFQRLVGDQGRRVDIDAGQMSPGRQRPKPRAKLRQVK